LTRISGEFVPEANREDLYLRWRTAVSRSLNWAQ